MLATPHLLVGAAIGKAVRRPWLALPAAVASHFLLDCVPHLDTHGLFGIKGGPVTRAETAGAAVDTVVGAALVIWLTRRQSRRALLLWCAFAGAAVDLFYNVPPWGRWFSAWPGTAWLGALHDRSSHAVGPDQWPLGFGTQAAVVALALLVLRGRRGHLPDEPAGAISPDPSGAF